MARTETKTGLLQERGNARSRNGTAAHSAGTNLPTTTAGVIERYRRRLSPTQLAWLRRGAGLIDGVPAGYEPGALEAYSSDTGGDR